MRPLPPLPKMPRLWPTMFLGGASLPMIALVAVAFFRKGDVALGTIATVMTVALVVVMFFLVRLHEKMRKNYYTLVELHGKLTALNDIEKETREELASLDDKGN